MGIGRLNLFFNLAARALQSAAAQPGSTEPTERGSAEMVMPQAGPGAQRAGHRTRLEKEAR